MSKIEKRGRGYSYRYRDETGKLRRSPTFEKQSEARADRDERFAKVRRSKLADGEPRARQLVPATFEDVAERFLAELEGDPERRSKKELASRIGTSRSTTGGRLRRRFGARLVHEISERDLASFRKALLREGMSNQSVVHHLNAMTAVLNYAQEHGHVREVVRTSRPRVETPPYNYLRDDEVGRFLIAAGEVARELGRRWRDDGEGLALLYQVAIGTGLRKGELACLGWDCVDFEREVAVVRASFNGPTKNGRVREVPLTLAPDLIAKLRMWRRRNRDCRWVFGGRRGGRLIPSSRHFSEYFVRTVETAEIPERLVQGQKMGLSFHDLRHTFATAYMANGGEIWRLRDYLGHADIKTTQRYAHPDTNAATKDRGILKF